jgi:hypothetical protein
MKTKLFNILLALCIISCSNNSIDDHVVAISAEKMNILYVGEDNPISIAASGLSTKELSVSINEGTISKENDHYNARLEQTGEVIITVKRGEKIISEKLFFVKERE